MSSTATEQKTPRRTKRSKGSVDTLPSGALRVRVYAGTDKLTGRPNYLQETVPVGPDTERIADQVLRRLLTSVDEKRHPKTKATINQLLDEHFDQLDVARSTKIRLLRLAKTHIRPIIGAHQAEAMDAERWDRYYTELRRCRDHCVSPNFTQHRTTRRHTCDARCRPHECKGLDDWTIRKTHSLMSGAYKRAKRWEWVSVNFNDLAEAPAAPAPNPEPPSPEEAALLLNAAWKDIFFGTLVWTAFTTSPRRAEICGFRWKDFDRKRKVLSVRRNVVQDGKDLWVKLPKTSHRRNIALDDESVAVLVDYYEYCVAEAAKVDLAITDESYIFSLSPDGSTPYRPETLTQRYNRLADRLGINTTIRRVRHYSATELIIAGVDIRTVAGRLGHSGGGTTTLKVYAAWVSEADQRASKVLMEHVPLRPAGPQNSIERAKTAPQAPYEVIAAEIRHQIISGEFVDGNPAPTVKAIAASHNASTGTAHRALGLLRTWGLVSETSRGIRAKITYSTEPDGIEVKVSAQTSPAPTKNAENLALLDLRLLKDGAPLFSFSTAADPANPSHLQRLLIRAAKRQGIFPDDLDDLELEVRRAGDPTLLTTFLAC
ncbi:tyrosine-type recombinase/integrase [Amycolatopsis thailandensis]|uniref:tyrosine-type recombinase/integrase n=1 Tax=Amycolatopsis thailandensis TaxID=589330 RepID=UPI00362D9CAC